jgi:hypothetical protein
MTGSGEDTPSSNDTIKYSWDERLTRRYNGYNVLVWALGNDTVVSSKAICYLLREEP